MCGVGGGGAGGGGGGGGGGQMGLGDRRRDADLILWIWRDSAWRRLLRRSIGSMAIDYEETGVAAARMGVTRG